MSETGDPPASLGERLRLIRTEVFGPEGVDDVARQLGVTPQTWKNYEEIGGLITAAQLLFFVELTGSHPLWLLRGEGPKYRGNTVPQDPCGESVPEPPGGG